MDLEWIGRRKDRGTEAKSGSLPLQRKRARAMRYHLDPRDVRERLHRECHDACVQREGHDGLPLHGHGFHFLYCSQGPEGVVLGVELFLAPRVFNS